MIQFITSDYAITVAILIGIYLILCQGFNLTFGLGGLFNLSHVASYGIGAYTSALLSTELGMPFVTCVMASVLVSALFAILVGLIAARLDDDYFAIGTLAFSAVVTALFINWKSLTRGVLGIPGIPRPSILGYEFVDNFGFLVLVTILAVFSQLVIWILFRNPIGRFLRAIGEFKHSASALGLEVRFWRNLSFMISSGCAGLAGSLFAFYLNYIDPSSFTLSEMIFVVTVVVVGRPGSFWGGVLATAGLIILPEALRFVELPPGVLGPLRQLLYAVVLFTVVYINRSRLFPVQRSI